MKPAKALSQGIKERVTIMTALQARYRLNNMKDIKECYVWALITPEHGEYFKSTKVAIREALDHFPPSAELNIRIHDDKMYING